MFREDKKGYIENKRSLRSQQAIENYEVPLSMFTKKLINECLDTYKSGKEYFEEYGFLTDEEIESLKKVTLNRWKEVAKAVGATSWHHTSLYFNKTDHYDILKLAFDVLKLGDKKIEVKKEFEYGVMIMKIFGGTKRYPKLIGFETVAGIVIDGWFYYPQCHKVNYVILKAKVDGSKVERLDTYKEYTKLTKKHPEYKNTKKVFNYLIKEKLGGKQKNYN